MAWLDAYFADKNHHPSPEHRDALREIAGTLESMANGVCEPKIFLSSVDCGVGKSSTALGFARALMASPDHRHVGMIVCVGRKVEADEVADALVDYRDNVVVLTQDTAADLTLDALDRAQVLVTTQQRVARATDGRSFGDIEAFRYLGAPRKVRAWDEAFLPGVAIALDSDALGPLLAPARRLSPEFRQALWALMGRLDEAQTGTPWLTCRTTLQFSVTCHPMTSWRG